MNKLVIPIIVIAIIVAGIGAYFVFQKPNVSKITSFEECVKAGYPILETAPRQCKTPDGKTFTESVTSTSKCGDGICGPIEKQKGICPQDCEQTSGCAENWQCASWSNCQNDKQTRTCADANNCGTIINKPVENKSCGEECKENWQCTSWSSCQSGKQTRTCSDSNKCGTATNKPGESQSCEEAKTPKEINENSPFGMDPAHIILQDTAYKEAKDMGVKWHRTSMFIAWMAVQKDINIQKYDFSIFDKYYGNVPVGINIMANIVPGIPRAENNHMLANSFLPIDEQKYKEFVKSAVERYDGDGIDDMPNLKNPILYWQVGNEPNDRTRKDFAKLQKITYEAIKEACSQCKVLVGGAAQPILPGTGFITDKNQYIERFKQDYEPILTELNGYGFDIFDFHWYGKADGDYRLIEPVYNELKQILGSYNFNVPVWATEMGAYSGDPSGDDFPYQSESQQASDYLKRFVYPLSLGIEKIFPAFGLIEGFKGSDGYFDHTGFIYDGKGSNDLGFGVKKLSYYTYKKMTEILEGSDWNNIETIQESGGVYIYKFTKNGKSIWVAWNDNSTEKQITISGISSSQVKITEAVPKYDSGKDVASYSTALRVLIKTVSNNQIIVTLGMDKPIFIEEK